MIRRTPFRTRESVARQILSSKLLLVGLIVLAILLVRAAYAIYQKKEAAEIKRDEVAQELAELDERQQFIESELERLSTQGGVEEELRSKFNVALPGEQVAIIVDPQEEDADRDEKTGGFFEGIGNWWRSLWQ